jgi:hypothetical protein
MTTHGPFGFATATTDGCNDFLWTASNGNQTADALPATTGNLQWWWNDDPTGSGGIGPDTGQEGDPEGYVYTETSDTGTGFNDTYDMEFDTALDASAEQWQFNFWTNQRGTDNGMTCQVQINESGGGWVDVGAEFGGLGDPDRIDTDGTAIWISRSVDLSNGGANVDASTLVRILLTMPAVGTTWHNDYGIDTVEIVGTPLAADHDQEAFQYFENGTESGAASLENQNIDLEIAKQEIFGLRVGAQLIGNPDPLSATLQQKETGDPASEWRDV